jgi:hypothetical protein
METRKQALQLAALTALSLSMLDGCRVAGDIFKAGFWVGFLAILLVVGLIAGGVAMLKR